MAQYEIIIRTESGEEAQEIVAGQAVDQQEATVVQAKKPTCSNWKSMTKFVAWSTPVYFASQYVNNKISNIGLETGDYTSQQRWNNAKQAIGYGTAIAGAVVAGAALGTAIAPGVGTAVGIVVGTMVGIGKSISDIYYSQDKKMIQANLEIKEINIKRNEVGFSYNTSRY